MMTTLRLINGTDGYVWLVAFANGQMHWLQRKGRIGDLIRS